MSPKDRGSFCHEYLIPNKTIVTQRNTDQMAE